MLLEFVVLNDFIRPSDLLFAYFSGRPAVHFAIPQQPRMLQWQYVARVRQPCCSQNVPQDNAEVQNKSQAYISKNGEWFSYAEDHLND